VTAPQPQRRAVLVIDDHPGIRDVTTMALERLGYRPIAAADGPAGIEAFDANKHEICCVMLDLAMPGIGGQAVFRSIRDRNLAVPIVVMSGHSDGALADWVRDDPRAAFMRKPFGLGDLRQILGRLA
jgi:two-component system cell cycle sensor histidine kinase/response regulator CckA